MLARRGALEGARSRAVRTPSRLRKSMVLRTSSNWMAAAPKAVGDARRTRAWLRAKVPPRESTCSPINDRTIDEDMAVRNNVTFPHSQLFSLLPPTCSLRYMSKASMYKHI